tara:strand:- start:5955 stop:7280 length:1326 start_codon:yes stop_codon:yes gene_type:complete
MIIRQFYILLLFIFISCASNPLSENINSWNSQKSDDYWYGTAIISKKNFDGQNIHKQATSQAISDIASQIKISIKSDFEIVVKEKNYEIDESSLYILNTRVDNNIEDIEILDFKNLEGSYILFARLSKDKFYSSLKRKSEIAIDIAKNYINDSKEPSLLSFQNLLNAEKEIIPYLDYSIEAKINGVDVNLYSFIQNTINDLLNRIKIEPSQSKVYIKKLGYNNELVTVKVYDANTNKSLSNIPLIFSINEKNEKCISNKDGQCSFNIQSQYISDQKNQNIAIAIDRESIFKQSDKYGFIIDSQIELEIVPTKIFLDIEEYNLDSKSSQSYIAPKIKEFFIKKYSVEFVDNISNSDLSIKIFANTRKIGSTKNEYGIYQVYSDANIYLEKNGEKITEISVNDIKGADFSSFNQAGNKSLEKLSKTFLKKTLPAIVDILIKSN